MSVMGEEGPERQNRVKSWFIITNFITKFFGIGAKIIYINNETHWFLFSRHIFTFFLNFQKISYFFRTEYI